MTTENEHGVSLDEMTSQAELIHFLVGAWHEHGYTDPAEGQAPIPPLGERSAYAVKAGHGAVQEIDKLIAALYQVRGQLVGELRQDADILLRRAAPPVR